MQINITARDFGGTEFLAQPHRLHLGAQKAEGVDQLEFSCRSSGTGVSSPSTSGTRTARWPSRWRWTKQAALPSCWRKFLLSSLQK